VRISGSPSSRCLKTTSPRPRRRRRRRCRERRCHRPAREWPDASRSGHDMSPQTVAAPSLAHPPLRSPISRRRGRRRWPGRALAPANGVLRLRERKVADRRSNACRIEQRQRRRWHRARAGRRDPETRAGRASARAPPPAPRARGVHAGERQSHGVSRPTMPKGASCMPAPSRRRDAAHDRSDDLDVRRQAPHAAPRRPRGCEAAGSSWRAPMARRPPPHRA